MDRTKISDDDEGKPIVNSNGKRVGTITEIRNGRAYVDPVSGIADSIRSKLGWGDKEQDDYRLEPGHIAKITDDEVQLKS